MAGGAPVTVDIETRTGRIGRAGVAYGRRSHTLLLLDSNVEGNSPEDRELTARLYGGTSACASGRSCSLGLAASRRWTCSGFRQAWCT